MESGHDPHWQYDRLLESAVFLLPGARPDSVRERVFALSEGFKGLPNPECSSSREEPH